MLLISLTLSSSSFSGTPGFVRLVQVWILAVCEFDRYGMIRLLKRESVFVPLDYMVPSLVLMSCPVASLMPKTFVRRSLQMEKVLWTIFVVGLVGGFYTLDSLLVG